MIGNMASSARTMKSPIKNAVTPLKPSSTFPLAAPAATKTFRAGHKAHFGCTGNDDAEPDRIIAKRLNQEENKRRACSLMIPAMSLSAVSIQCLP